jgi:hypothetical protein
MARSPMGMRSITERSIESAAAERLVLRNVVEHPGGALSSDHDDDDGEDTLDNEVSGMCRLYFELISACWCRITFCLHWLLALLACRTRAE